MPPKLTLVGGSSKSKELCLRVADVEGPGDNELTNGRTTHQAPSSIATRAVASQVHLHVLHTLCMIIVITHNVHNI